ncbi:putative proteinDH DEHYDROGENASE UBIQUINONE 1 ALPHA SUBCOMPLEX SUBUNIT 13 [Salix viminalis]|uniref:NADH dehydrogenase [ubiquinone] 1 alpha subcomplex subunit 13 n=4 Tax=Salix TaxID=40685 RepID=A0A9Q0T727_SALVM|nr:putative proteinDH DEHYDROGENASE UBIQUINONE 1 ALPHA SUBCOMPLEX SUBUNIT 13 [Salix viminalis]
MTEAVIRNKPGMASVKDMPILQDGPPPGGFAPVRFARRIPNKGPSAMAIFLAAFGAFSYGMYQVGQGNKVRRALKEEKYAARRAILPLLQAEEDERFVKEWNKYLEYEAEVMKDVPGWKVGQSVYNSGRWMPPATGELRPEVWFLEHGCVPRPTLAGNFALPKLRSLLVNFVANEVSLGNEKRLGVKWFHRNSTSFNKCEEKQ